MISLQVAIGICEGTFNGFSSIEDSYIAYSMDHFLSPVHADHGPKRGKVSSPTSQLTRLENRPLTSPFIVSGKRLRRYREIQTEQFDRIFNDKHNLATIVRKMTRWSMSDLTKNGDQCTHTDAWDVHVQDCLGCGCESCVYRRDPIVG